MRATPHESRRLHAFVADWYGRSIFHVPLRPAPHHIILLNLLVVMLPLILLSFILLVFLIIIFLGALFTPLLDFDVFIAPPEFRYESPTPPQQPKPHARIHVYTLVGKQTTPV